MSNVSPITISGLLGSYAPHACVRCSKRKVKCERSLPSCPKCVEAKSACVYLAPQPRRKRVARQRSSIGHSNTLGRHNASLPAPDQLRFSPNWSDSHASPSLSISERKQSVIGTKRRRLEAAHLSPGRQPNEIHLESTDGANELWSALGDAQGREPERSEAPLDIGLDHIKAADPNANAMWGPSTIIDLAPYWPSSAAIISLWNNYLENFHHIVKIVHGPSVSKIVHAGIESCAGLSPAEQALLCCMFATSLYTMSDEDCLSEHKEERSLLLARYRAVARHALFNANFLLSTDIMVLQAFVMLLVSLRHTQESSSLWSLWGIAVRNGKRIGLDRAKETSHYTPLENQERQWLWFNLIYMDAYVAEIAGAHRPWAEFREHFSTPSNLDDDDLSPSMTEVPAQKAGGTDVTFTILRCDWIRSVQKLGLQHGRKNSAERDTVFKTQIAAIDEIEQVLIRKYVHPCDPTVPSQFLIMLTAKQMIADWRLSVYRFKMDSDEINSAGCQEDSRKLVDLALKVLEYEYLAQSTSSLQIFAWHLQDRQPRQALILLLGELRFRTTGPQVDKAWLQVERCLVAHPVILRFDDRSWTWHLGSLILEAWEQREKARRQQQFAPIVPPHFLSQLRAQRARNIDTTKKVLTPALSSTTSGSWEVCPSSGIPKVNGVPYMSDFDRVNNVTGTLDFLLDNTLGPDYSLETESVPLLDWSQWYAPTGDVDTGQLP